MIPAVDWDIALEAGGLGKVQHFLVNEITALKDGAALLDTQPVATWKKYLAFHLADQYANHLPKAFDEANFDFYRKALRGIEVQRERWKRGMGLLDDLIGEGVGELYVAKYFPPGHKAAMDALVANLRTAHGRAPQDAGVDGRRDAGRGAEEAGDVRSAHRLSVEVARLLGARRREGQAARERAQRAARSSGGARSARLGKPVDRAEWDMNPQTVNAGYNPLMNQITFPAAILQPPFFDPNADPAVNYGAIGAVIGHEIGHGFDDQGRKFDETGKIRELVERADRTRSSGPDRRSSAAQYDAFCPLPDTLHQRQADDGREHRRPRRPRDGLRGLQGVAERQASAGDRRLHRRSALLPGACAGVAHADARRRAAQPDPDQPARPRQRRGVDSGRNSTPGTPRSA